MGRERKFMRPPNQVHQVVMSDKPATGPTQPFNEETFANEPELRPPLTKEEKARRQAEVLKYNAELQRKADEERKAAEEEQKRVQSVVKAIQYRGEELRYRSAMYAIPLPQGFAQQAIRLALEGRKLVPTDKRKRREELIAGIATINAGIAKTTKEWVKREIFLKQREEAASVAHTEPATKPEHFYSLTELMDEALEHRGVLKRKRRELEDELHAIDSAALLKAAPLVAELHKRVKDSDREECEKLGYPPVTSPWSQALESLAYRMTDTASLMHLDASIMNEVLKG
jgi:hypothetical protein